MASSKRKLIADFERRLQYSERVGDGTDILRRPRSVAIVVHLTADDRARLCTYQVSPDECTSVDAYWQFDDAVYWIEVRAQQIGGAPAGIYYAYERDLQRDSFYAVVPESAITTGHLHTLLAVLENEIDAGTIQVARHKFVSAMLPIGAWPQTKP